MSRPQLAAIARGRARALDGRLLHDDDADAIRRSSSTARRRTCTCSAWSPSRSSTSSCGRRSRSSPGGKVRRAHAGDFAAYYIVWTLVRNMNIVFTPYGWEGGSARVSSRGGCCAPSTRSTTTSPGSPAGRSPWLLCYLPIGVVLTLVFDPSFDVAACRDRVFAVAIWGAYLIRSFNQGALGLFASGRRGGRALLALHRRSSSCSPGGSCR